MLDSLYIAATGMHAQQSHLDTISHNLANVNTTAFKKSKIDFSDLLYKPNDTASAEENIHNLQGMGSSIARIGKDFIAGELKLTNDPFNVAIKGRGFFEVELENGEIAYTRNGALKVDADGYLGTIDGYRLSAQIQLPPDTTEIKIDENGLVEALVSGESEPISIGQIELTSFLSDEGLDATGSNLYLETKDSGVPVSARPGELTNGKLAQGYLESSNVDMVAELLELVIAQRAYEVNSKIIVASDEILKINNNLRS